MGEGVGKPVDGLVEGVVVDGEADAQVVRRVERVARDGGQVHGLPVGQAPPVPPARLRLLVLMASAVRRRCACTCWSLLSRFVRFSVDTTSSLDAWAVATEVDRARQMWSLTRPRPRRADEGTQENRKG